MTDPSQVSVDFFQSDQLIGSVNVRSSSSVGEYVRVSVEVPIVPGTDYRLESATLEFRTDAIAPSIMLEAANGSLTEQITFSRADSSVRLVVPDTGTHGNGTVLFGFLAGADVFENGGLTLHAELRFRAGDAETDIPIVPAR